MTDGARVVLDASAVLAWVLRERGYETVDRLLEHGMVPASAMTETLYRAVERGHRMAPRDLQQALLALGLRVEPVLGEDSVRAATLIAASRGEKGERSLSLGDGLCLAVAERLQLPVVGGDEYWEPLELSVPYYPFR